MEHEPRSLEERVARLESRAESRSAVLAALVFAALAVWALLELDVLKLGAGIG